MPFGTPVILGGGVLLFHGTLGTPVTGAGPFVGLALSFFGMRYALPPAGGE